jgi:hypothetical protein
MLTAMRWTSSRVNSLAAARRPRLLFAVDVGERLTVVVADDEALPIKLMIGLSTDQVGEKRRRYLRRARSSRQVTVHQQQPTAGGRPSAPGDAASNRPFS